MLTLACRQLRSGYERRGKGQFPHSLMLVGLRDVRDYRIYSAEEKKEILGGSAFNIAAEKIMIQRFGREHIKALADQHEANKGQRFLPEAVDALLDWTAGQPWCVNRIMYEASLDRDKADVCRMDINSAAEAIIRKRETHLDHLVEYLKKERVRRAIEPLIRGADPGRSGMPEEDLQFLVDLGLLKRTDDGRYLFLNKIYSEIIPRTVAALAPIPEISSVDRHKFYDGNRRLKMKEIMDSYVLFHNRTFGFLKDATEYKENVLHIVLFAYLQHIVYGEGRVRREFAVNDDSTDVILEQRMKDGSVQEEVIEVKCYRPTDTSSWPSFVRRAQEQLARKYLSPMSLKSGYLIIWNQKASTAKKPKKPQALVDDEAPFAADDSTATTTQQASLSSSPPPPPPPPGRWTTDVVDGLTVYTVVM